MSARSPHWVTVRTDSGWHVRLIGGNGEPILTSEPYTDRRSADRAITIAKVAQDSAFLEVDERSQESG